VKDLAEFFRKHDRIAIAGGPKSGKTTLSALHESDRPVLHTDDFQHVSWGDLPQVVLSQAVLYEPRWIVEGVQVPRLLRKGLPADAVLWLSGAGERLTAGQETMAKGCRTVFDDWLSTGPSCYVLEV